MLPPRTLRLGPYPRVPNRVRPSVRAEFSSPARPGSTLSTVSEVAATKRHRRSADETRQIILDAAVAWIEENGTAGLKVVDVSRSSGVSEVLIYRYFTDRSGLLTAALVELWERYMTAPVDEARVALEALPDEEITADLLAGLHVLPNQDTYRRRRWARLQVLAASAELPALSAMIRQTQTRLNREFEELIALIQDRMPGRHAVSPRMLRMLNESLSFGFVLQDMSDDLISDAEFKEFLREFFRRFYEPDLG